MKLTDGKVAGTLLFVGAVQFIVFGLITAEAGYEGYSTSGNYISDLGVGSTALIFNSSVFLLGILIVQVPTSFSGSSAQSSFLSF
jgi:hypothetical membrane protein